MGIGSKVGSNEEYAKMERHASMKLRLSFHTKNLNIKGKEAYNYVFKTMINDSKYSFPHIVYTATKGHICMWEVRRLNAKSRTWKKL